MQTNFRELLRILSEAEVDFIVVGGVAASVHGSPRLTLDLDIVYERSKDNIERLVQALTPLKPYLRGAPPGLPFQCDTETMRRGLNFTFVTTLGSLDLLGEITGGGGFDNLKPHSVLVKLHGFDCLCLDLVWLIKVKRAAGRPKDFEAIAELEAIVEEQNKIGL